MEIIASGNSSSFIVTLINKTTNTFFVVDTNIGDRPISLDIHNISSGEKIRYSGPVFKASYRYVSFGPGGCKYYDVDIGAYGIKKPGSYSIVPIYGDPAGRYKWFGLPFIFNLK